MKYQGGPNLYPTLNSILGKQRVTLWMAIYFFWLKVFFKIRKCLQLPKTCFYWLLLSSTSYELNYIELVMNSTPFLSEVQKGSWKVFRWEGSSEGKILYLGWVVLKGFEQGWPSNIPFILHPELRYGHSFGCISAPRSIPPLFPILGSPIQLFIPVNLWIPIGKLHSPI